MIARILTRLGVCFAAGAFGALISSFFIYSSGAYGMTAGLGVRIAPELTLSWLYPRIVGGGLWGLLFLFAHPNEDGWLTRALAVSILPTAYQLFYVLPYLNDHGLFGLHLGTLTPALVFFMNLVWALAAAIWIRLARI